jgi:hypothetical protein
MSSPSFNLRLQDAPKAGACEVKANARELQVWLFLAADLGATPKQIREAKDYLARRYGETPLSAKELRAFLQTQ